MAGRLRRSNASPGTRLSTKSRRGCRAISEEHGPESILPYSYAGTIGQLGYGSMDRRFFHRLGASQLDRTICSSAGGAALNSIYGTRLGTAPQDFAHAGLIIAWARQHPRQQHSSVAFHRGGSPQRSAPCGDRPVQDAHCRTCGRLAAPSGPVPMGFSRSR